LALAADVASSCDNSTESTERILVADENLKEPADSNGTEQLGRKEMDGAVEGNVGNLPVPPILSEADLKLNAVYGD